MATSYNDKLATICEISSNGQKNLKQITSTSVKYRKLTTMLLCLLAFGVLALHSCSNYRDKLESEYTTSDWNSVIKDFEKYSEKSFKIKEKIGAKDFEKLTRLFRLDSLGGKDSTIVFEYFEFVEEAEKLYEMLKVAMSGGYGVKCKDCGNVSGCQLTYNQKERLNEIEAKFDEKQSEFNKQLRDAVKDVKETIEQFIPEPTPQPIEYDGEEYEPTDSGEDW